MQKIIINNKYFFVFLLMQVLQYCDFFLGILAFWVTLVAMAEISVKYISFFHMLGAIIITFQIKSDKTGFLSSSIPMIIGIFIPVIFFFFFFFIIIHESN
jgi:hypothetical protein